jgi:hypothetical protein
MSTKLDIYEFERKALPSVWVPSIIVSETLRRIERRLDFVYVADRVSDVRVLLNSTPDTCMVCNSLLALWSDRGQKRPSMQQHIHYQYRQHRVTTPRNDGRVRHTRTRPLNGSITELASR